MIPLDHVKFLVLETHSYCDLQCPTCMRQSDPTRNRWKDGVKLNVRMPHETVLKILDQASELGFKGMAALVGYCEPLLDPRLPAFVRYAKEKNLYTYTSTNGTVLTPDLAKELDGFLTYIHVSVYGEDLEARKKHFASLFNKTEVRFSSKHATTHYSPRGNLESKIKRFLHWPCDTARDYLHIRYWGDLALCCEDVNAVFKLGNIHSQTLEELWLGNRNQKIMQNLRSPRGRLKYPFCRICPRPGYPYGYLDVQRTLFSNLGIELDYGVKFTDRERQS